MSYYEDGKDASGTGQSWWKKRRKDYDDGYDTGMAMMMAKMQKWQSWSPQMSQHICEDCGQTIPSAKDTPGPSSRS